MSFPTLVFATLNLNKLKEVSVLLSGIVDVKGLVEFGLKGELMENGETLKENALQKARFIADRLELPCFADDTGLEVEALNNEPGVYSARYSGKSGEDIAIENMKLLLKNLKGKQNRKAVFRTVIAWVDGPTEVFFEGFVKGEILNEAIGVDGFGYDPIFKPLGYNKSFAQMSMNEKNTISHRGQALRKLKDFLKA